MRAAQRRGAGGVAVVEGSDATTAMETERDDSVVVPLLSEAPLDADGSNVGRASVLSSTINHP